MSNFIVLYCLKGLAKNRNWQNHILFKWDRSICLRHLDWLLCHKIKVAEQVGKLGEHFFIIILTIGIKSFANKKLPFPKIMMGVFVEDNKLFGKI